MTSRHMANKVFLTHIARHDGQVLPQLSHLHLKASKALKGRL